MSAIRTHELKILLADDHDLVREAVATFLEREGDLVVSQASNLQEALRQIKVEGGYDLVLLDYRMPGMDGLKGLAAAISANDGRPVALLSGNAPRPVVEAALANGAAGFVPKTLPASSMLNAVRFMALGEQYAPAQWFASPDEAPPNPLLDQLSPRERQVLQRLCKGASNKEIARDLDIKEVTVKLHVRTLCRKLDARNRTHAAMIARDAGFA